ncbi:hypothetical protein BDN72DRAFT_176667 [Pluteus cervinus]|uniref:Uncharacterized protein n=1 Tax=Pluteus cervinus TaxID=181527 RepID=A0ACD3AJM4_9AGAR|nr:hypothetical protein BDN72DRAFT_176667 [Pluteus cervinus]
MLRSIDLFSSHNTRRLCAVHRQRIQNMAPPTLSPTVVMFHSLNIFALVLVLVVLTTAILTKSLRRVKTWYTFLCIQLFFAIAFLLHPFKQPDFQPAFVPCLLQAVLVHAVPSTASWALFALVLEVYVLIRTNSTADRKFKFFLLGLPIVVFTGEVLVVLLAGLKYPYAVGMNPDGLYCHLTCSTLRSIVDTILCLVPIIVSFILFCLIGLKAYRYSRGLQAQRETAISSFTPLSILRIGTLILAPIPVFGCVIQGHTTLRLKLCNFLPLMPILTAIAFGTQKDMFSALFIWRSESS